MRVAVACDHAGFPLKATVLEAVRLAGHEPLDLGTDSQEPVDFPDFTLKLGHSIQSGDAQRGVLICGSGVGACVAANKMKGIYASICHDTYSAAQGVLHDDINVLCLGGRVIGPELARVLVAAFLGSSYLGNDPAGGRLARRVAKIHAMEDGRPLGD